MTTAVTQAIIDGFFDARNGDPFATFGMHETERGIEIRTLLPDVSMSVAFLLVLFQIVVIFLLINYRFFGEMKRK